MITLHRLNGSPIVVNHDLIETVETTPDTMIAFTTGRKLAVQESVEEVIRLTLEFKKMQHCFMQSLE